MIDLESFKTHINNIRDALYYEKNFQRIVHGENVRVPNCVDSVITLLSSIFHNNLFGDELIRYFVYDLDFGKNYCEGDVKTKQGEVIPMATIEDLYNELCRTNGEENE